MGIVRPVMEVFPYAWMFFVPFILMTTFVMMNLFIAVIVNAMQSQHQEEQDQAVAEIAGEAHNEREAILTELRALRTEVRALRQQQEARWRPPAEADAGKS